MTTPTFTPNDIVMFASQKDAVNMKAAFDQIIGQKVLDAVQDRKMETAAQMFNASTEETTDSEELESVKQLSGSDEESTTNTEQPQQTTDGEEQINQGTEESDEDA